MKRQGVYYAPWERATLSQAERPKGELIAYDFETTPIPRAERGVLTHKTVEPRYLTAHGAVYRYSRAISDYEHLARVLRDEFLLPDRHLTRYVAWNGNRFDTRLIFEAVALFLEDFVIVPYVANKGGLRGARIEREDYSWEFLDGVSMTGLTGRSLAFFLDRFAPQYRKLSGVIDFERETFNPKNPLHVAYAERDAEGLYHGLVRAGEILTNLTGRTLQVTIGNLGIKYTTANIPVGTKIWAAREAHLDAIRRFGLRGGYVFVSRAFDGPAWSYDVNQAYAGAMREQELPAGNSAFTRHFQSDLPGSYFAHLSREERSPVPFYVRTLEGRPLETYGEGVETFLLSNEIVTLRRWGWKVTIRSGWVWRESFRLQRMVDSLEDLRQNCDGGPDGAVGTMVKMLGNNAFGKSAEAVSGLRIVIAKTLPGEEWTPWREEDPELAMFWCRSEEPKRKRYHRPQIAAFITSSVRCKLYEAIMAAPLGAFLKADTDSLTFDRPVDHLDLHPTRYGAFKVEAAGERHIILGKKVYAREVGDAWKFVCKGLTTKKLTVEDFERWHRTGEPPVQEQVQLTSWKAGIGNGMYRVQRRRGTNFRRLTPGGPGMAAATGAGPSSPFP